MANNEAVFYYGLQAKYDALATNLDESALYFITDSHRIYRGSTLIVETNVQFTTTQPTTSNTEPGILYVYTDSTSGKTTTVVNTGSDVITVGGGTISGDDIANGSITLDKFASDLVVTEIGENPTNTTIPTAKAVADAIKSAVDSIDLTEYDDAITGVTAEKAEDKTGTILTFTRKSGTNPIDVTIADLFLSSASYNSKTHILTLIVGTGESASPVEVNLEELLPAVISTNDVAMTSANKIVVTTNVGNFTAGQTIDLGDTGTLQEFLQKMLSEDSWPTITKPSVSLTETNNPSSSNFEYEVGSSVIPSFSSTFNAGSYGQTYNNDQVVTGITPIVWTATCTGQSSITDGTVSTPTTKTTFTGTFNPVKVVDNTNVNVSVSATYTDAVSGPKTKMGKTELDGVTSESKKILGSQGPATATKNGVIKGYRKMFYGVISSTPTPLDSASIRALTGVKVNKTIQNITAPRGTTQVIFAYPSSYSSVNPTIEYKVGDWVPFTEFVKSVVSVDGVTAGEDSVNYNVWVFTPSIALSAAETLFRFKIN